MSSASDPATHPASIVSFGVTTDGVRQLRRSWPVDDPVAVCVIVHGINEHSGRYERVGRALAGAGISAMAHDQRGFGRSGGRRGHIDTFDTYVDDLAERVASARTAGVPVVVLGHSMGGLIVLRSVLAQRVVPDALVLSAPALGDGVAEWMHKLARPMAAIVPRLRLRSPFPSSVLSRDPVACMAYDNDPLVERKTSVRLGAEMFATMAWARDHVSELAVPTLVIHGADDELVPPHCTEILADAPGVERRVLPGLRHEPFQEPEGPQVIAEVIQWIAGQLPRG